jgi:hypothetical protein
MAEGRVAERRFDASRVGDDVVGDEQTARAERLDDRFEQRKIDV